ncbi:hypothetical protein ACOBR2_07930 [Telmatobacter bradus]
MQTSPETLSSGLSVPGPARASAGLAYEGLTLAAMIGLLLSLWAY